MSFFKQIDENGNVICLFEYDYQAIIDDPFIIEITQEEYNALMAELFPEDNA